MDSYKVYYSMGRHYIRWLAYENGIDRAIRYFCDFPYDVTDNNCFYYGVRDGLRQIEEKG